MAAIKTTWTVLWLFTVTFLVFSTYRRAITTFKGRTNLKEQSYEERSGWQVSYDVNFAPNLRVLAELFKRNEVPRSLARRKSKQTWRRASSFYFPMMLLLLAGDVAANPGPRRGPKYPCQVCAKAVRSNQRGICCDACEGWCHMNCVDMNITEYNKFTNDPLLTWYCQNCLFPFTDSFLDSMNASNENIPLDATFLVNNERPAPFVNNERAKLKDGLDTFRDTKGTKIAHVNVGNGGLLHHLDGLSELCKNINPDVMAVSETWLTELTATNCVNIDGYDFYRRDKPKDFIGAQGVGIYVKHGLSTTARTDLEQPSLMNTAVQLNFPNRKPVIVNVLYRHPQTPVSFLDKIEELFKHLDSLKANVVITGDFNLDFSGRKTLDGCAKKLDDIAKAYGFLQTISSPTRITESTATCIDLTFTNLQSYTAGVGIVSIADHLMNFIVLGRSNSPSHHRFVISRNFKNLDKAKFLNDLKEVPWHIIECFNDIEDAWYSWKVLFSEVINQHAPLRKFRAPKSPKTPWFDEKIESLKKVRDYYHRRATTGNLPKDWESYRNTRNQVTRLVRKSKKDYYTSLIDQNKGNSKSMWKILKGLLPKCSSGGITALEVNGTLITDFKNIANSFNAFFTDIGLKLAATINVVNVNPVDYVKQCFPKQPNIFKFKDIKEKDVLKLIKNIPGGKATGMDNFQVKVLKIAAPEISRSLAYLFNFSLKTGKFPADWKLARITPIHKKGPKIDQENYRPVSILPVISKFIERLVHNQLYDHLVQNNLLCMQQSGFRKRHSCQTSLHRLHEQLYEDLFNGKVVGLIALDLRKAFDTVDHKIMLDKLKYYGVNGTEHDWFKSYLHNRFQICSIYNNMSDSHKITCGVPQGSILGPLMFIIYVNDMPKCFKDCNVNIYADDTTFYVADTSVDAVSRILQTELEFVHRWLCCNKLSLHIGKTSSMLICSRQKRIHLDNQELNLKLNGYEIEQTNSLKYLGIQIDCNLRYDEYVNILVKKINRATGVLRRASRFVNQATRITLYNTLILPHLDYCSTIWGNNISKSDIKRLQRLQNCAMRIILECDRLSCTKTMLDTLKWLSVEQRLLYNTGVLIWKMSNNETPSYLSDIISKTSHNHDYETRASTDDKLFIKQGHSKSLSVYGSNCWNSIPSNIRNVTSYRTFKTAYLKHLRTEIEPDNQ